MQALPQSAGPPSPASPSHILSLLHTQTFFQLHLEFVPSILKETCLDSVSLFTITLSGFFFTASPWKSYPYFSFPSHQCLNPLWPGFRPHHTSALVTITRCSLQWACLAPPYHEGGLWCVYFLRHTLSWLARYHCPLVCLLLPHLSRLHLF